MKTDPLTAPRTSHRVTALDALRGFALCGILLVNIPQITHMPYVDLSSGEPVPYPVHTMLDLLVETRFFPIFSFLFGLSFAIFLETAAPRSGRPRLLLLRRLVALGVLGVGHHLLQPGEALLPYAIVGLLILLPASWLPAKIVLPSGLLLLGASVTVASGGIPAIPGLFLLGLAVAKMGIPRTLDRRGRQLAVLLAVAAPLAIAAGAWQYTYPLGGPLATRIMSIAGLLGAVTYACALLLVIRTRPGRTVARLVLEPLGRMALTNYVTATLIIVAAAGPLGLEDSARWGTALVLATGILIVQAVFSNWWMERFRYGPLEWALRTITWWRRVPLRRPAEPVREERVPRPRPAPEPRYVSDSEPTRPQWSPDAGHGGVFYDPPEPRQWAVESAPAYDGPHWFEAPWTGARHTGIRR